MNPALLQHSYPVDYQQTSEHKYFGQDRTFTNSTSLANNDFLQNRKPQNVMTSGPLGQTLALPSNIGLDYNSHNLVQNSPYHSTSQLLLSPPSSVDGSTNTSLHPTSAGFHSNAARFVSSNASTADQFSTSSGPYLPPTWSDPNVMDFGRPRLTTLPPTLSPPMTYGPSGISGQYFTSANRSGDHYINNFSSGRSQYGPQTSHSFFEKPKNSSIHNSSMPITYPSGCLFPSTLPQASTRPEGPPFEDTKVILPLVTGRNQSLIPEISAGIQKGFFQVDGKWTCYRRNYFTVACAFHFQNATPDGSVYLQRHSQLEPVQQYAVSISARTANVTNQESESRTLVQHTPKRDKATESVPGRQLVAPASAQAMHSHTSLLAGSGYAGPHHIAPGMLGAFDAYAAQNHHSIPTSYTFERIQFQRATANNGKRRAQQQYFHVVVELSVNIGRSNGDENWVLVATRQSFPMVVRGRSPGHYKDSLRRDGHSNMDPDRGINGGEGGPGSYSMPSLMGVRQSGDWTTPQRGHGQNYGHAYTNGNRSGSSSSTTSSSVGFGVSQDNDAFQLASRDATEAKQIDECYRHVLAPVSQHDANSVICRKRPFEEDNSDGDDHYYNTPSGEDNFSPVTYGFSNNNNTRRLCASS